MKYPNLFIFLFQLNEIIYWFAAWYQTCFKWYYSSIMVFVLFLLLNRIRRLGFSPSRSNSNGCDAAAIGTSTWAHNFQASNRNLSLSRAGQNVRQYSHAAAKFIQTTALCLFYTARRKQLSFCINYVNIGKKPQEYHWSLVVITGEINEKWIKRSEWMIMMMN
jgi:hypothetical protein